MTREAIEAVLEKFRPHFRGDGSDLLLGSIDTTGVVEVQCLLPQDMIDKVLDNEIRAIAPELVRVEIRMLKTY